VSKHFKPAFVALACAAVFGLAQPAAAADRIAMTPPHAPSGKASATVYHRPARPLFGMQTEPTMGDVSSKWHAVEAEIEHEQAVMARCRTDQTCPAAARVLLGIIAEGVNRTGRARVGLVNRAVNLALIPTSDETQWGVADRWSPPFETLQTHRGDCEDYAIVKYAALREVGFSPDDLKIVVLHNVMPNEDHAVLAARVDGEWLILDNRTLVLVHDFDIVRSQPILMLDQDGAHRLISLNHVTDSTYEVAGGRARPISGRATWLQPFADFQGMRHRLV
jgi:predicted transglutaminase-like cysteine proteinase